MLGSFLASLLGAILAWVTALLVYGFLVSVGTITP